MMALLPRSLRARLILGAVIWIAVGVSAAGVFISALFRQHATALVDSEMHGHLEELGTLIDVHLDGMPELSRTLSDPRFSQSDSGYSWQVSRNGKPLIKSTSVSTANPPSGRSGRSNGRITSVSSTRALAIWRSRSAVRRTAMTLRSPRCAPRSSPYATIVPNYWTPTWIWRSDSSPIHTRCAPQSCTSTWCYAAGSAPRRARSTGLTRY